MACLFDDLRSSLGKTLELYIKHVELYLKHVELHVQLVELYSKPVELYLKPLELYVKPRNYIYIYKTWGTIYVFFLETKSAILDQLESKHYPEVK